MYYKPQKIELFKPVFENEINIRFQKLLTNRYPLNFYATHIKTFKPFKNEHQQTFSSH